MCARWDQEGNFIDLSLTEDNSSPSASLVAITNDLRARTRFIVAQPVTFSAADPERREGLPACVCAQRWWWWGVLGGCARCQTYVPQSPQTGRCQQGRQGGGRGEESKWRRRGEARWRGMLTDIKSSSERLPLKKIRLQVKTHVYAHAGTQAASLMPHFQNSLLKKKI